MSQILLSRRNRNELGNIQRGVLVFTQEKQGQERPWVGGDDKHSREGMRTNPQQKD